MPQLCSREWVEVVYGCVCVCVCVCDEMSHGFPSPDPNQLRVKGCVSRERITIMAGFPRKGPSIITSQSNRTSSRRDRDGDIKRLATQHNLRATRLE